MFWASPQAFPMLHSLCVLCLSILVARAITEKGSKHTRKHTQITGTKRETGKPKLKARMKITADVFQKYRKKPSKQKNSS